jgi:hypothetical protein
MGNDQCFIWADEVFLTWRNLHYIEVGPDGRWQLTKDGSEIVGRMPPEAEVDTMFTRIKQHVTPEWLRYWWEGRQSARGIDKLVAAGLVQRWIGEDGVTLHCRSRDGSETCMDPQGNLWEMIHRQD